MRIKTILPTIFFFLSFHCLAQNTPAKQIQAIRTTKPIKIDGLINEEAWKEGSVMDNLVEFRPTVGRLEEPENRTITYLMLMMKEFILPAIATNVQKTVLPPNWPAEMGLEPMTT